MRHRGVVIALAAVSIGGMYLTRNSRAVIAVRSCSCSCHMEPLSSFDISSQNEFMLTTSPCEHLAYCDRDK
jgi:hypothetical protein